MVGRLLGVKNPPKNSTLNSAGWAVSQAGSTTVYENRLIYSVYDKSEENNELSQVVRIRAFGDRFKWIAENVDKGMLVVTGNLSFKPTVYEGKAFGNVSVDVFNIDLISDGKKGDGAQAPSTPKAANRQAPSNPKQAPKPDVSDDEDLPF